MGNSNGTDTNRGQVTSLVEQSYGRIVKCKDRKLLYSTKLGKGQLLNYLSTSSLPQSICNSFTLLCNGVNEHITIQEYASAVHKVIDGLPGDRVVLLLCGDETTKQILKDTYNQMLSMCITYLKSVDQTNYWSKLPNGDIQGLCNSLICNLPDPINIDKLESWLNTNPLADGCLNQCMRLALHMNQQRTVTVPENGTEAKSELLDWCLLMALAPHLKAAHKQQWTMIYSSTLHGASYLTMIKRINKKGPCILIVKDSDNYVFGAYISHGFVMGPKFIGDDSCFVFTMQPHFTIFPSTGYNHQYAYCNANQETMPNGLGIGGSIESGFPYFALWLSDEFGKGHSLGNNSTFKNRQLSKTEQFTYETVEVWAVEIPKQDEADMSILDKADAETRAVLELAGKEHHSDGLREPDTGYDGPL